MSYIKQYLGFIKSEFRSYSGNTRIVVLVLLALAALFAISSLQILIGGLGYTNMNNRFAWAAWIVGDLSLIALGGGAFFTAFMYYILRRDEFRPIIYSAVLIGFLCDLFTLVFLLFDIGQPLRFWFGYRYPNWGTALIPNSMLTLVFFSLTYYFIILVIEMIPPILEHRGLLKFRAVKIILPWLHALMFIFAAAGTFFSFFHQGSLGATYGVLFARPAWFRPELFPYFNSMFFMFFLSALAVGPSVTVFFTRLAGKIMKKEIVPYTTYSRLASVSGTMFAIYFAYRCWDLYMMVKVTVPAFDRNFMDLWGGTYGTWLLGLELAFCFMPVILLNGKKLRAKSGLLMTGTGCGIIGMVLNRFNVTIHGFSVPSFPWQDFGRYFPSFQEWAVVFGIIACIILIYMWCAKYLPLFPHLEEEK